jgi:putative aldouronate transport system substrate-binding protein
MCKTSLAESMGWDLLSVKKLSDLTPFLQQAKEAGIKYPYTCQNTAYFNRYYLDSFDFIETYAGISKTGDSTKIINVIDTDEYKEYCELMYSWARAGYINETESTKSTNLAVCYTDDYAFALWTEVPNNQPACSERYSDDMTLLAVTSKWISSNGALGSCYAVSGNSKKADACLKFLELLYTDQTLADLWTWGIEGENYIKQADGKVVRNDENTSYVHDVWETNTIKAPSLLAEEPDNKVELYDEFNASGIPSMAMGFRFDSTNVEAEYTAVANAESEFGYLLETGAINPETGIPVYIDALNEAGLQKILNEMQSQYDAWLADK